MKTTAPLPPQRVRSSSSDQLRELLRVVSLQLTNRTGLCPLGSCHPFHGVRHPATWAAVKLRHVPRWRTSARFRSPRIVRHYASLFFYGKVHGSAPGFRRSEDSAVAALPVQLTWMKWFASSVFWKASIVCSPSFCMERACGSVRVCNCGSGSGLDHGTIIVRRARAPRSGLMLPESLAPSLRAAVARAWWLEGPSRRGARALALLPTP